jgi:hypothetical protein
MAGQGVKFKAPSWWLVTWTPSGDKRRALFDTREDAERHRRMLEVRGFMSSLTDMGENPWPDGRERPAAQ